MPKSKTTKNIKLFENDSDEDFTLKTNTSYAKHYDEFRKKELLSHLKNISDEESSSSDDCSTDEELVNPEFDKEFFNALAYLKSKDPTKYNEVPTFFKDIPTVEETVKSKQQSKSQKPLTVADHQREILIKTKGLMSDDEEDKNDQKNVADMSYVAEQEKIKSDLKKALSTSDDEEDNLFQVRNKSNEEIQKEQNDYQKWLTSQNSKAMKPLKEFWTSNQLTKDDKFLRDYILNQRYIENGQESNFKDMVGISEDEEEFEKQTEYEHKYNFRFEEPDTEFIKRFPRQIDDTHRIENTKRKEKRKERDERKAKEKELKMKELRELQNIRKREIEEKLLILKDVAGNEDFHLKEDDLNSDFDPNEHDRRMAELFNNEYYGIDEGEQKPQFPDIDEELNIEDWDNFDKNKVPMPEYDQVDEVEAHCEDDDFNMDCDYDPQQQKKDKLQKELIDMSKGRKRKKKTSKLAEIIKREKPAYDPSIGKTYEEYLDEYYKLDYEDIIGDQPCRFNYVECVPNDFGLSVEEILMASNKELNQWASLKKTMQNRPKNVEMNDVEKYNRWRNNMNLKKKIFKSIFGEASENEDSEEGSGDEQKEVPKVVEQNTEAPIAKKKKKKNKKKKAQAADLNSTQTNKPQDQQKSVNNKVESCKQDDTKKQGKNKLKTETLEGQQNKANNKDHQNSTNNEKSTETINANKSKIKKKNKRATDGEINSLSNNNPFKDNGKNNRKRKLDESESHQKNNSKKRKFDNKKNWKQNSSPGDSRLKAFGINPKKFHNKLKYGQQNQHQNNKNRNFKK